MNTCRTFYLFFVATSMCHLVFAIMNMKSDKMNNLFVEGPEIIVGGNAITLKCNVPKKYYQNSFDWKHSEKSLNQTGVTTFKNESQSSYQSYLTIENISNNFNGNISCTVLKKPKNVPEQKSFTINVHGGPNERKISVFIIMICTVSATIFFGIFVIFAVYLNKKFRKKLTFDGAVNFKNETVHKWYPNLEIWDQRVILSYAPQWEFPRENLKLGKLLSAGTFSVVFKAKAISIVEENVTTTVAVKTVKNSDPYNLDVLTSELKIMIDIGKHINVINLLGVCAVNTDNYLMVILEYCRFGNIHKYLLKQKSHFVNQVTEADLIDYRHETIPEKPNDKQTRDRTTASEKYGSSDSTKFGSDIHLVNNKTDSKTRSTDTEEDEKNNTDIRTFCTYDLIFWSFQIGRGMEYLAGRNILHGDLAARNILLTKENIVKICDFKFSKNMYHSTCYKKQSKKDLFPFKWMAIESIRDRVFSTQSDVWSFGIVLWEIFSLAATPYKNIQIRNLFKRLVEGYRMEKPKFSNTKIYEIMLDCWKAEPLKRPSFTELAIRLGDFLQESTKEDYTQLNENYMETNNMIFPTNHTSVLPTEQYYLNSQLTIKTVRDSSQSKNSSESSDDRDDPEPKPTFSREDKAIPLP